MADFYPPYVFMPLGKRGMKKYMARLVDMSTCKPTAHIDQPYCDQKSPMTHYWKIVTYFWAFLTNFVHP